MGYVIYPDHFLLDTSATNSMVAARQTFDIVNHSWTTADNLVSIFDGGKSDNLKELIENSIAWAVAETLKGNKSRFLMIEELQELLADEKLMKELEDGQG